MFGGGGDDASGAAAENIAFSSSNAFGGGAASGADFWSKELAWQQEELKKPFEVTIGDPQTISAGFMGAQSYTVYVVRSEVCKDGVRRRYSDFDWLRDVLVARFHGIAVPLMPEKRLVGNQSKGFIEERMAGLEQFLLLVVSNPYLRLDATLRTFFTTPDGPAWEQAKRSAAGGVGADPSSNPGLARWFGVLRALPLPVDADAACNELAAAVDDMEARVVATLGAVTRWWEASKASADALRAMRDTLSDWSTSSATNAGAMSETLKALKDHTGVLSSKLKKGADAFSNAHDLAVFSPNEIQIFLLDGLVTETHRLRSLKALLTVRDGATKAYGAAWTNQDKLHFQMKQWREKGREDKAVQLEPKVAEAVASMKRMKERLDDISKGVLHVESDRFARARTARFVAMAGQYAALCIASGVRSQELWAGFLTTMELDQNAMVADAQATLTQQTSIHAIDATPGAAVSLPVPSAVLAGGSYATAAPSPARPAMGSMGGSAAVPMDGSGAPAGAMFGGESAPASSGAMFTGSASTVDL